MGDLAHAIRNYAPEIREQTLSPGCLLRAVIADQQGEVDRTVLNDPLPAVTPAQGHEDFGHLARIELAFDGHRKQLVIDGLGDVGTVAHFEFMFELAAQYRVDRGAELKPENYLFIPAEILMDRLGIDSETALRQGMAQGWLP